MVLRLDVFCKSFLVPLQLYLTFESWFRSEWLVIPSLHVYEKLETPQ